jgi:hypothetical protein
MLFVSETSDAAVTVDVAETAEDDPPLLLPPPQPAIRPVASTAVARNRRVDVLPIGLIMMFRS